MILRNVLILDIIIVITAILVSLFCYCDDYDNSRPSAWIDGR